jgi:hypothetical protein
MGAPEFHQTRMGQRLYEHTMPELIRQIERLVEKLPTARAESIPPNPHSTTTAPFQPGSRVVIRHNPHHGDASDIVGEVVDFQPSAGFVGCDLAYVRYKRPSDGTVHELPFSTANLEAGDRESLLARADRHDQEAAKLRRMADEVAR